MAKKIPPLDLMFFLSETAENPKHVGALQIFELPPNAPQSYLNDLVATMKQQLPVPPFSCRPHFPRTGMPEWCEDKNIDMDYHVRHSALPAPGARPQLLEVIQRLHSGALDRQRPCWFCQIIEGLEDRRFAIYYKIHHSYIDGMSGVKRMYGALSNSPTEQDFTTSWALREEKPRKQRTSGVMERVSKTSRTAIAQARAVTEVYESFAKMGLQWLKIHDSYNQVPFDAPRTLMNRAVERDTRAIGVCTLPLDRVKAAGSAMAGKVNDVVLAVVDAALHDYLEHRGENTDTPLVALCPMSLREPGDDTANTQASALHIRLGDPEADVRTRLAQVVDSTFKAKQEAREVSRSGLIDFGIVMFGAFEFLERSGLDSTLPASYNVLVSNVPGPKGGEMYLRGSRFIASYPISTFLPGTNLNVTVLSHGNSIDFGLLADKHAMPDIARVVEFIERRFAQLEQQLRGSSSPRKKRQTKTVSNKKPPAKTKAAMKKKPATQKKAAAKKRPARKKPARKKNSVARRKPATR